MQQASVSSTSPYRWLAAALGASVALLAWLMVHETLALTFEPVVDMVLAATGIAACLIVYALRRPRTEVHRACRDIVEYVALFAGICFVGAVAAYPVAAASRGFVDPGLQQVDHALHFDWLAWYSFVAQRPWLQPIERGAYEAIFLSPAILLVHFAWSGQRIEAGRFLASFWLAGVLTLAMFAWLPARGPLAMVGYGPLPYTPQSALYQATIIPELRGHQLHAVALGALRGLVGAPSFHTASAVLYIAAAWPIRRLRWPLLALNSAMLLATPVEGTHYLADMLVGGAVAASALALIRALEGATATRRAPLRVLATG